MCSGFIEAQTEVRRGKPITEDVYASEMDPDGELLVFADGESVYAASAGGRCLCDLVSCSRTNWVSGEVTHWRQRPHHYDSDLPDCPNASPGRWVVLFRPSFVSALLEEFMVPYMIPRGYVGESKSSEVEKLSGKDLEITSGDLTGCFPPRLAWRVCLAKPCSAIFSPGDASV